MLAVEERGLHAGLVGGRWSLDFEVETGGDAAEFEFGS